MSKQSMSLMDMCFFIAESERNQKHVAAALFATYAEGQDYQYLENLISKMRKFDTAVAPFNLQVKSFMRVPYGFRQQEHLDMNYHMQLHELPGLDDKATCNKFVAELHSKLMDRDKPMWQLHLIYDKQSRNFVIYARIHHIYGDGISMIRWVMSSMTDAPQDEIPRFWQLEREKSQQQRDPWWKKALATSWMILSNTKDMLWLSFRLLARMLRINRHFMPAPFSAKHTVLTGNMEPGRVITTTKLSLDEINDTAKKLRATVNELMLTTVDMALQQFLKDHGDDLSKESLIGIMPISLRRKDDTTPGNKITLALIELAKDEHDPYRRLRQVIESNNLLKEISHQVKPMAFIHFNILWQVFAFAAEVLNLSNLLKPLGNVVISNVPGPKKGCFFGNCEVKTFFPLSTLAPGGGMNITLVSYNGTMDIGFICCNKHVKNLEPIAEYTQRAFLLLQQSVDSTTTDIDNISSDELFMSRIGQEIDSDSISDQLNKKIA